MGPSNGDRPLSVSDLLQFKQSDPVARISSAGAATVRTTTDSPGLQCRANTWLNLTSSQSLPFGGTRWSPGALELKRRLPGGFSQRRRSATPSTLGLQRMVKPLTRVGLDRPSIDSALLDIGRRFGETTPSACASTAIYRSGGVDHVAEPRFPCSPGTQLRRLSPLHDLLYRKGSWRSAFGAPRY